MSLAELQKAAHSDFDCEVCKVFTNSDGWWCGLCNLEMCKPCYNLGRHWEYGHEHPEVEVA